MLTLSKTTSLQKLCLFDCNHTVGEEEDLRGGPVRGGGGLRGL